MHIIQDCCIHCSLHRGNRQVASATACAQATTEPRAQGQRRRHHSSARKGNATCLRDRMLHALTTRVLAQVARSTRCSDKCVLAQVVSLRRSFPCAGRPPLSPRACSFRRSSLAQVIPFADNRFEGHPLSRSSLAQGCLCHPGKQDSLS